MSDQDKALGLKTVTLREYYRVFNTVSPPGAADMARQERLFEITLNGVKLGDGLLQMRKDLSFTSYLEQRYEEGLFLGRLLLVAGLDVASIESQKPPLPDTCVTFADGQKQQVEMAIIVDPSTAQLEGIREYLSFGIRKAVASDAALRQAIAGAEILVTFDSLPTRNADSDACVVEIVDALKTIKIVPLSFPTLIEFDSKYGMLHSHGARGRYIRSSMFSIRVGRPLVVADPQAAVNQFWQMLGSKKGKTYSGADSIWLALSLDDIGQVEADALAAMAAELPKVDLGQFSRLLVGYERGIQVLPPF